MPQVDLLSGITGIALAVPVIYFLTGIGIDQRNSGGSFVDRCGRYLVHVKGILQCLSADYPVLQHHNRNLGIDLKITGLATALTADGGSSCMSGLLPADRC